MMGEASEIRFGNPLSFPMCGFNKDEWVMAILQAGSFGEYLINTYGIGKSLSH
jgi:hypothetical protein